MWLRWHRGHRTPISLFEFMVATVDALVHCRVGHIAGRCEWPVGHGAGLSKATCDGDRWIGSRPR